MQLDSVVLSRKSKETLRKSTITCACSVQAMFITMHFDSNITHSKSCLFFRAKNGLFLQINKHAFGDFSCNGGSIHQIPVYTNLIIQNILGLIILLLQPHQDLWRMPIRQPCGIPLRFDLMW